MGHTNEKPAAWNEDPECEYLNAAYVLAGLAMMLNIRLSYSSAPYALIRFKLPENLFSVFVRRMASALELWCLPSMALGNIIDIIQKALYNKILLPISAYKLKNEAGTQDDQGLRQKAKTLSSDAESLAGQLTEADLATRTARDKATALQKAASQDNPPGLKQLLTALSSATDLSDVVASAKEVLAKYNEVAGKYNEVAEDPKAKSKSAELGKVESAFNQLQTEFNKIIRLDKFYLIIVPSIVTQWLNFLTYVILLIVYVMGGDQGRLTTFYWTIAISGVVFGINMTLLYSADWRYIPVYIAGENSFPIVTSFIHYLTTLMFGNRRKWNSDYLVVCVDIVVAIIISFAAAVVWTWAYLCELNDDETKEVKDMKHILAEGFDVRPTHVDMATPTFMVIVGMGLVYAIYPGIAPGMIVPFYLVDKIEMVLLIATFFPPVIIAILRRYKKELKKWSVLQPGCKWGSDEKNQYTQKYLNSGEAGDPVHAWHWHVIGIILMVTKITLAAIFIYSLHYRDSTLSRSIVNQPKMSTTLTIIFYMCHECLLAAGFPGIVGDNAGANYVLIAQYIGALFMIFLAFYSEGYIIEYKSHDPSHWPTTGMKIWNAF